MGVNVKDLERQALQLRVQERAELVSALIASLEGDLQDSDEEIRAAWDAEIERRVEDMEAGRIKFVDAREALQALRARAAQRRQA